MIKIIKRCFTAVVCSALIAPSLLADSQACEPTQGMLPVCGFSAPEDIVTLPDGRLLIGQMAAPGGLRWLDPESLATGEVAIRSQAGLSMWGEEDCRQPPAQSLIHGMDLRAREDGRWQLLTVNHGEREALEFFEVIHTREGYEALWRGCAVAPEGVGFNDVAGLPGGGFLVTNMAPPSRPLWSAFMSILGFDSGEVWHWEKEQGFRALPETRGRFPNGIVMAPGDDGFYVNMYMADRVEHYSWPGLELLRHVPVEQPDNSSWAPDGSLLVASQHANLLALARSLRQAPDQPSLLPYSVQRIDMESFTRSELFRWADLPMGAGTVAVQSGEWLWVGSYVGDRVVRVLPAAVPRQ